MNILAVSPHFDDVELGCGGLLTRWASEGHRVDVLVCMGGNVQMHHSGAVASFEERLKEQGLASDDLSVNMLDPLQFASPARFDEQPMMGLVSMFDERFPEYDRLLIPLPSYMQDHTVVFNAALAATRPGRCNSTQIYAYEQPQQFHGMQVHGALPQRTYAAFGPADLAAQKQALLRHQSQFGGRTDSIYGPDTVELLARLRGKECGVEFACLLYPIRTWL